LSIIGGVKSWTREFGQGGTGRPAGQLEQLPGLSIRQISFKLLRHTIFKMTPLPERLDEEKLADWRAGRNAVYQLAALTIAARLAVADAW
jgi:hypothetical protein